MRERDVRQRIESFLKRTARDMIIPASVGLSLALSGCTSDAVYDYGTPFSQMDAGTYADVPVAIVPYGVPPMPDASARQVGVPDASMDAAAPDVGVDSVTPDADVDAEVIDGETD